MVRWLKGSSGLFLIPIIPSESDLISTNASRVKPLFVFIAFAIQIMQQEYIPQINTQSTQHVFSTTLSLTLYGDMR